MLNTQNAVALPHRTKLYRKDPTERLNKAMKRHVDVVFIFLNDIPTETNYLTSQAMAAKNHRSLGVKRLRGSCR